MVSDAISEDRLLPTLQLEQALHSAEDGPAVLRVLRAAPLAEVEGINLAGKNLQPQDAAVLGAALRGAVRLRVLVLSQNALGDAAARLVAALRDAQVPLEMLSVDANGLGPQGVTDLLESLQSTQVLGLSLDDNPLGAAGMEQLANGLPTCTRFLSVSGTQASAEGALALARALSQRGLPLEQLAMRHTLMGDEAGAQLIGALPRSMAELDLSGNGLGIKSAESLSQMLQSETLEVLLLEMNDLGDAGCAALAQGLKSSGLRVCNLADNALEAAAAHALAAALPASPLRMLEISRNELGQGAEALLLGMANSGLESVSASEIGLLPQHATATAALLRSAPLQALDLAENDLGDEVCAAMAAALPQSQLSAVRLDSNSISSAGATQLAQAIAGLGDGCGLRLLSLADNAIDDTGAEALSRAVMPLADASCNLEGNPLSEQGIAALESLAATM